MDSDVSAYIIETDPSLDRMLEDPQFAELGVREAFVGDEPDPTWDDYLRPDGQIVVYRCETWPEIRAGLAAVWARAEFDDLIIVDNITRPWEEVQSFYWQTVCGVEQDDFLLDLRKRQLAAGDRTAKPAEASFNEWSYLNPHYAKHFTRLMLNPPCHLYMTAEQTEVVALYDEKQKETWALYGVLGAKPKGQKKAGHLSHTVLHLTKTKGGEHRMTTVKDRGGRDEYLRAEWESFSVSYLEEIAGWTTSNAPTPAARTTESPAPKPAAPKPKPGAAPKPKPKP